MILEHSVCGGAGEDEFGLGFVGRLAHASLSLAFSRIRGTFSVFCEIVTDRILRVSPSCSDGHVINMATS